MAVVTPFPGLNGLLAELVVGAKIVLGANFVGAYLQGSFAVGDADEFSDVDFIVVTHDPLTGSEQAGLQSFTRDFTSWTTRGVAPRGFVCAEGSDFDVRSRELVRAVVSRVTDSRFLVAGKQCGRTCVLSICRMHQTMERGVVTSKRQAAEWALGALDPCWATLIERALGDRADPWQRVDEPAKPEAVAETMAFVAYAVSLTGEFHP